MNRLITSIVQIAIAVPALYLGRMLWREIMADLHEWDKSH